MKLLFTLSQTSSSLGEVNSIFISTSHYHTKVNCFVHVGSDEWKLIHTKYKKCYFSLWWKPQLFIVYLVKIVFHFSLESSHIKTWMLLNFADPYDYRMLSAYFVRYLQHAKKNFKAALMDSSSPSLNLHTVVL